MIQRLDLAEAPAIDVGEDASATMRPADEQIRSWLEVLSRLLPVGEARRTAIRDELQEHLHERVRDLMVGGRDEGEAVRLAIDELGEAAELARRYQCAGRTRSRRILMNLTMLGVGAGVVLAGVVAYSPNASSIRPVAYQSPASRDDSTLEKVRVTVEIGMTMNDFVRTVIDDAKLGVSVDWGAMEDAGLERETEIGISGRDMPLSGALALLAENSQGVLGWRVDGEMLLLNTAEHFDLRERTLVVYDVRNVVHAVAEHEAIEPSEASDKISEVLISFVEPESWEEMGGALAHLQFIGSKLFIEAPPRMHEKVRWVLEQLTEDAELDPRGRALRSPDSEGGLLTLDPVLRGDPDSGR